jgi:HTH-type transcriptional regulator / antitoxin HigA
MTANYFASSEGRMTMTPLHDEAGYARAVEEIERLWGAPDGTPEGDHLEILITLVAAYEDEHHAIEPPDPIDAIVERMEVLGMSRSDLSVLLDASSSRVSDILNRRRHLTLGMIRKLAEGLKLSEHCLVQDYELAREFA